MTDYTTLPDNLPVPENDGAADHLPGSRLPALKLPTSDSGMVDLAALGPGRSIIYLYPLTGRPGVDLPDGWDTIPGARGCSTEACDFRDHFADLRRAGASRVYGLSSQDPDYQAEVVERLHLPFPMLSDLKHDLVTALGIKHPGEGVAMRATFIVDPDNVIQHVTVNGLNVGRNPAETLRVLDALQTDELCPCNWTAGEEVLRPAA
jgi:peroxiredoxin